MILHERSRRRHPSRKCIHFVSLIVLDGSIEASPAQFQIIGQALGITDVSLSLVYIIY